MCGRFTTPFTGSDLEARFELSRNVGYFEKTWNAAPGQMIPVITKNSPKKGIFMKWGFVHPWEKDFTKAKFKPINARDDKLESGYFKQSFISKRCLVPTSGYYEWKKFDLDGKEQKQPYYFKVAKQEIFSLGGIYSVHKDAEGKEFYFFCIITTSPNSLQKPIHNRMPFIVPEEKEDEWLETDSPINIIKPFSASEMEMWRVPTLVSSFKNDGPQLVEKLAGD